MGGSGTGTQPVLKGMSAGCGMAPPASAGAGPNNLKIQQLMVPSCAAGAITPHCVAPPFQPGGADYIKSGQYDFNNRNYGLALPDGYNPMTPYPVILEGGGCTGGPTNNGGGYNAGEGGNAIRVGLSYVGQCFADGGVGGNTGFGCSIDEAHIADCINTPEVPYINGILDYLEAHLCVDLGRIFIGGYSSGAWEASTVSCALANRIRAMSTTFGGLRINRPACTGPTPGLMLAGALDNSNPIGPMVMGMGLPSVGLSAAQVDADIVMLDSYGSAPMRDELLSRNGCTGTATTMYSAAYPQCMSYTGCPADYPVVWCDLAGVGHGGGGVDSMGVMYAPAAWDFLSKLPAL
jgi:poly(3-hydroxybutyrate) depolymerase